MAPFQLYLIERIESGLFNRRLMTAYVIVSKVFVGDVIISCVASISSVSIC